MKKINIKAFTLVELIVVITILAILWTIAFINLQWYSTEARDSKRITDVNNVFKKITLERVKWIYPSNIMKNWVDTSTWLLVWWVIPTDSKQWSVEFTEIKEEENNFKDPRWNDYVFSYATWWNGTWAFKFVQLATLSEEKNEAIVVWDYYKIQPTDSASIVFSDPTNLASPLVVDGQSILPYEVSWTASIWGWPVVTTCTFDWTSTFDWTCTFWS